MKTLILATMLASLCALAPPTLSTAQTITGTEVLPAAADARTLYKQAEALRTGKDGAADPDGALALYEELAATGYRPALQRLGKIYIELGRGKDALAAYEQAAAQDSALARLQIAIGHMRGSFGALSDPSQGFPRLVEIAASEDSDSALYALAEAYRRGQGTDKDLARAFEIYTTLAERGYASSYLRLGDLYRLGRGVPRDLEAAIKNYELAIAGGKTRALMGLGKAQLAAGQPDAALASWTRATELKIKGAEAALAMGNFEGSFGKASRPAAGLRELRRLAEQGDINAGRVVLRELENRRSRIDSATLDAILTHMTDAAAAGNARVTASLARFYRLQKRRVPDSKARHAKVVDMFGDQLKPSVFAAEKVYAIFDPGAPLTSRPKLVEFVRTAPNDSFETAMRSLRSIDRNAYTNVMQQELKSAGFYGGPINGLLTKRTIRSALEFCLDLGVLPTCNQGPLTGAAAKLMIKGFAERRK